MSREKRKEIKSEQTKNHSKKQKIFKINTPPHFGLSNSSPSSAISPMESMTSAAALSWEDVGRCFAAALCGWREGKA